MILPPLPPSAFLESLKPGQTLMAMVKGTQSAPTLHIAGQRIPLAAGTPFLPGQSVTVEVLQGESGVQLRLVPQADASGQQAAQTVAAGAQPTATAQPAGADLSPVLLGVLDSLGALQRAGEAHQLLPATLPMKDAVVRQLLALFTTQGTTGQDLQLIQSLVGQAAALGAVPQNVSDGFAALLAQLFGVSGGADARQALHQLAGGPSRGIEARIALAIATGNFEALGETLRSDLEAQLSELRRDDALLRFLQGSGQLRNFEQAVDRVLERFTSAQLQNLRSLELPYQFLEVPFPPDSPFDRVQVHFFGEGGGKGGFSSKDATVVLDLSMTRLGDVWVALSIARGRCTCRFRAANPAAVQAIRAEKDDLVQALATAGYPGAQVRVEPWNGDRLTEAAALMRRFSGINVSG